ncbi:N-methylhydantoinase (ATP-hydrolyzing) [[Actinomadura] parvosata subsp. kistnae]|nr:N-methylhydantoinase (ATP-hydrolyzing) [Actinomadura parvosata subsp. kistnae]
MTGAQVKRTAVPRTLTLARTVGRTLREARSRAADPVAALADALRDTLYGHLRVLFRGKVTDVERRTEAGFARGRAAAVSFDGRHELELMFQNEHLVALVDGEPRCIVPDLVCVLESEQAEPITTESLRYGQRITVVGISTPALMRTPEALAVFGPAAFGLPYPFRPVEEVA